MRGACERMHVLAHACKEPRMHAQTLACVRKLPACSKAPMRTLPCTGDTSTAAPAGSAASFSAVSPAALIRNSSTPALCALRQVDALIQQRGVARRRQALEHASRLLSMRARRWQLRPSPWLLGSGALAMAKKPGLESPTCVRCEVHAARWGILVRCARVRRARAPASGSPLQRSAWRPGGAPPLGRMHAAAARQLAAHAPRFVSRCPCVKISNK